MNLAQWLEGRLSVEHLSLRRAAGKTGLSHATIAGILRSARPSAVTIMKLAKAFSADGQQRLVLEDHLLTLAGYRSERLGEEQTYFLKTIPLLTGEHQHIVEVLVREFAKLEGIEWDEVDKKSHKKGT